MKDFFKQVKTYLLTSSLLLLIAIPMTSVLANEKGEAGQTGEVEFYLESSSDIPKPKPKPKPKPTPDPKPIIKLPQTGSQSTIIPYVIGSTLVLTTGIVVLERRKSHE